MLRLGYYNGVVGELETMQIPFNDRACFFGDGVYDAAYARNGRIFAADEHADRFFESALLMHMEPAFDKTALIILLHELSAKVDANEQFVYWQLTRGTEERKHTYESLRHNLWISVTPRSLVRKEVEFNVILADDKRHGYCKAKTLNLIANITALQTAKRFASDEAILCKNGFITECAHRNVSILKDGVLYTSPADDKILAGVGRAHLMETCKRRSISVREQAFDVIRLFDADEVIITSAGAPCTAVAKINGIPVGGKARDVFEALQDELYKEFEAGTSL